MNSKIEVLKYRMYDDKDLGKYRNGLKQFAETHKVINLSTTVSSTGNGSDYMFATILYEDTDKINPIGV